jgi:NAD(P)-dependent dehydrogenase (short-subunit alcohol dehydrogenase family)
MSGSSRRDVLVIGAAGGVGQEVARLLSGRYRVTGTVRETVQADAVKAFAPKIAAVHTLDLAGADVVESSLDRILSSASDLAAVIVCAAVCPNGPLETTPASVLRDALEINAVSHLRIFQRSMPLLRQTQGRLIFVSSYSGQVGMPFTGAYVASKFALEGMADVMRREVCKWGVPVILIQPGGIRTSMVTRQMAELKLKTAALSDAERELYGDRYRQFALLMDAGYPTATPPLEVAKTIRRALQATRPKARYRVGADAKHLLRLNEQRSDLAMDELCLQFFAAVDPPA